MLLSFPRDRSLLLEFEEDALDVFFDGGKARIGLQRLELLLPRLADQADVVGAAQQDFQASEGLHHDGGAARVATDNLTQELSHGRIVCCQLVKGIVRPED